MHFSFDYFREQVLQFYKICGDKRSTVNELEIARKGLFYVYLNSDGDTEKMAVMLQAADMNFFMRLPFFEQKEKNEI
jgi:hypothetical protein